MKMLISAVLALSVQFLAEGAIGNLPIGSVDTVETYDITNANTCETTLTYWTTAGSSVVRWISHTNETFTDKEDMQAKQAPRLAKDLATLGILTNSAIDRGREMTIQNIYRHQKVLYWSANTPKVSFGLIQTNGIYYPPTAIPDAIPCMGQQLLPIMVKNLKWARIEVKRVEESTPFLVIDSRTQTGPPTEASFASSIEMDNLFYNGTICVGVPFACSSSDGEYRLRVYIASGANADYEIFNEAGVHVAETPLEIKNFSVGDTSIRMDVVGGDPGRVFAIEKSTDFVTWTVCPATTNVVSSEQLCRVSLPKGNEPRAFFRARAIALSAAALPPPSQRIENFNVSTDIQFDVVGGDIGDKFVVERSIDLRNWVTQPATNIVSTITTHLSFPKGNENKIFFRTKIVF